MISKGLADFGRSTVPKRTGDFDAWLAEELTDPRVAASYVNAAISEAPDLLPVVLREVAKAHKMAKVAKQADIARESLYTILSDAGNPTWGNLTGILRAMGLKMLVTPESEESDMQTPAHPAVEDRGPIHMNDRGAIEVLKKANINLQNQAGMSFLVAESALVGTDLNFNIELGLGIHADEPLVTGILISGAFNPAQASIQERIGVHREISKIPVLTYGGKFSASAGIGVRQTRP
jgi:probable addiction module antidote protein